MKLIMESWNRYLINEDNSGFTPEELAELEDAHSAMVDAYAPPMDEGISDFARGVGKKLGRAAMIGGLALGALGGTPAKAAGPTDTTTTTQVAKAEVSPKSLLGALQHYINSKPDLKSKVNAEEATMALQVKLAKMRDGKPTEGFTQAEQGFVDTLAKIVQSHPEMAGQFASLGMVQIDYVDVNPVRGGN
jgi:hypothetical protein